MAKTGRSALVRPVSELLGKLNAVHSDALQPEGLRCLIGDALATLEPLIDELVRLEPDEPWLLLDTRRT